MVNIMAHKAAVFQIMNMQNVDSIDGQLFEILLHELDKIQLKDKNKDIRGKLTASKDSPAHTLIWKEQTDGYQRDYDKHLD